MKSGRLYEHTSERKLYPAVSCRATGSRPTQESELSHSKNTQRCSCQGKSRSSRWCSALQQRTLRALVTVQPKFQLSIHDDEGWFGKKYPPEVDVLVFDVAEHIRDVERLKGLYDVFAETLHQLSKLGIAGQENHGVTT